MSEGSCFVVSVSNRVISNDDSNWSGVRQIFDLIAINVQVLTIMFGGTFRSAVMILLISWILGRDIAERDLSVSSTTLFCRMLRYCNLLEVLSEGEFFAWNDYGGPYYGDNAVVDDEGRGGRGRGRGRGLFLVIEMVNWVDL